MNRRRLTALLLAGSVLAGGARAADPALAATVPPAATVAAPVAGAPPATAAGAPAIASVTPVTPVTPAAPAVGTAPGRATVQAPPYSPGPSAGNLMQTIFALILVLGILFALAWVMKRYGPKIQGNGAGMRIVGALNLGGRERIMVVEIGDQWIVVGASPGRVNALASMPKQEGAPIQASLAQHTPSASSFAEWLKQTIDKRNAQ